jgi:hypothetical protein
MRRRLLIALALLLGVSGAAGEPVEVHGSDSVFAAPGVVVVWGVLRGATEEDTQVVLRIATVAGRFTHARVEAVDPFGGARRTVAGPLPLASPVDVRMPRATFAEFPRREIRLYPTEAAAAAGRAALTVYYLGVPDTTPEFPTEAALSHWLGSDLTLRHR